MMKNSNDDDDESGDEDDKNDDDDDDNNDDNLCLQTDSMKNNVQHHDRRTCQGLDPLFPSRSGRTFIGESATAINISCARVQVAGAKTILRHGDDGWIDRWIDRSIDGLRDRLID